MHVDLDFEKSSEIEQGSELEFDSEQCIEQDLMQVELCSDSQELGFATKIGQTSNY